MLGIYASASYYKSDTMYTSYTNTRGITYDFSNSRTSGEFETSSSGGSDFTRYVTITLYQVDETTEVYRNSLVKVSGYAATLTDSWTSANSPRYLLIQHMVMSNSEVDFWSKEYYALWYASGTWQDAIYNN